MYGKSGKEKREPGSVVSMRGEREKKKWRSKVGKHVYEKTRKRKQESESVKEESWKIGVPGWEKGWYNKEIKKGIASVRILSGGGAAHL